MLLRVVDIETTGATPPAEIIEIGWVDVVHSAQGWNVGRPQSQLFRPLNGIPPGTMAVHHLTESDFDDRTPPCSPLTLQQSLASEPVPAALVAHNCDFERGFISAASTGSTPWICTYKAALKLWPDAPKHSNQVLRYWKGLDLPADLAMPPHRAGPDAYVTAQILALMLAEASVDDLVRWTKEPKCYPTVHFGKHRGQPWTNVPSDYLLWMTGQSDMDSDERWCAQRELDKRNAA